VSDAELVALYKRAEMLAHPSLYEGFGLTVLEAFACGTPVVSSNRASLPEVVGDAAALVNPENPNEMAEAISGLLAVPARRAAFVEKGRERVKLFSWDRTARLTLAAYREALEQP
jgi:glycosyltransferase involved in cell wall biosynthesis